MVESQSARQHTQTFGSLHYLYQVAKDKMAREYKERWNIVEDLQQGSQAFVHKVEDLSGNLEGLFVLKRLRNPHRLARFVAEVSALQELNHVGITRLVDFDLEVERAWFVQEYCEGGDLEDYVESGRLVGEKQSFDFLIQLCEALDYAHTKQKLHRDIKPANILLRGSDGPVVLGDFGLTFPATDEGERLTLTDEQVGSRFYMAPELREGRLENPTWGCDIYSLGKVFYFMLTKGRKFDRENFDDVSNDVVRLTDNIYLDHANNLFRKMITFDPEQRSPASKIASEARQARRLVEGKYPPLLVRHYSQCKYCGIGMYQPVASDLGEYSSYFGYTSSAITTGAEGLRAMACNYCGHIQLFRIGGTGGDWWPRRN